MCRCSPAARSSRRARRCSSRNRTARTRRFSSLYGTQVFENKFVLQFGRFNTLDLYSAHPFTGGEGIDRFMNLSLVAPPISARTVPPSAEGVIFSVLKGAHPALTLGLIESTEDGFFENGATFMWNAALPVKLSKTLPGGISVGGEIGSFEGTSLDQTPWAFIPALGIPLETVQGAWTLNVSVDQFVWMHPNDPTKGMGVFGMFGVSDGDPSLLRTQLFVGFGGAAPFEGRSADSFGAAFFYNDVSNDLEDTLAPLPAHPQRAGRGALLRLGARRLEPGHRRPAGHRPLPAALRNADLLRRALEGDVSSLSFLSIHRRSAS